MQISLSSDYFELFDLPKQFAVDEQKLKQRYMELQRVTHPDKFAAATEAERRWSVQAAAHINSAHETLAKPLARATYLLKLNDIDLDVETDTQMAPDFLMTQMELREAIEEIPSAGDPYQAVDKVRKLIRSEIVTVTDAFDSSFTAADFAASRNNAREWQFLDKLLREVGDVEARLDDEV